MAIRVDGRNSELRLRSHAVKRQPPWHVALVGRSRSWLRFVDKGWSTKRDSLIPFIEAFNGTALWEHLQVLRIRAAALVIPEPNDLTGVLDRTKVPVRRSFSPVRSALR